MKILIFGATGFIGNSIFQALVTEHDVTIASRKPLDGYSKWRHVDFTQDCDWENLLDGFELVINAVGIIEGDFTRIQVDTPLKLYTACIHRKIKIIHISAVGAEKELPLTIFLQTKKTTDDFLLNNARARVVYPGIVLGPRGRSTQFFAEIARFPLIPVFSNKPIPFVHISQLTELTVGIVNDFENYPSQVFAVSEPESFRSFLTALKGKKARFLTVPAPLLNVLFYILPKASIGVFNRDSFEIFKTTSSADYKPMFDRASGHLDPTRIHKSDSIPLFFALLAISFIWVWSGVTSLISWDESYRLVQELGANHGVSLFCILSGCVVDIILGFAVFIKDYRRKAIVLQILTMLVYMIILSVLAPHYWLHPFGVLSKNIPLFALSFYVYHKNP